MANYLVDSIAFIIRDNCHSGWIMTIEGFFDAPMDTMDPK